LKLFSDDIISAEEIKIEYQNINNQNFDEWRNHNNNNNLNNNVNQLQFNQN